MPKHQGQSEGVKQRLPLVVFKGRNDDQANKFMYDWSKPRSYD